MNPLAPLIFFFGKGLLRHAVLLVGLSIISWYITIEGIGWGGYLLWISLILLATIIIWRAGDFFSSAATYIQEKYEIPHSIGCNRSNNDWSSRGWNFKHRWFRAL